ncbi:MAG TPA: M15 family metallopeptidase [Candidatus Saccharimonadales bacterium]|nr:M15 family metallopeptidase [Candidatus Saccharimonadales bacterium]
MSTTITKLTDVLRQPIPIQATARQLKQGYRTYPVLTGTERNAEPLVDIALYGIAGQSYYSRPNRTTGDAVPGIDPVIRVRKSIAERLAAINHALQNSEAVRELFGGPVELYVEEGTRSLALQEQLYNQVFPAFIASSHPKLTPEQVLAERDKLIARPATVSSVPPHATGGAIDIALRHAHPDLCYVPKSLIPMGRKTGISTVAQPDYYEQKQTPTHPEERLRRNRRIFYWVMRGALQQDDTGFVCNPDEWWHWSYGDQMWAALTQAPAAFFSEMEQKA